MKNFTRQSNFEISLLNRRSDVQNPTLRLPPKRCAILGGMLHEHLYTDSRFPDLEILISSGTRKVFEKGTLIADTKLPNVKDIASYVQGLFDGLEYQASEIRDIRLKDLPEITPVI
jgi:hypothetical protein